MDEIFRRGAHVGLVQDVGQDEGVVRRRSEGCLLLSNGMRAIGVLYVGDDSHGGGKDRGVAVCKAVYRKATRTEPLSEKKLRHEGWTHRSWKLEAGALSLQVQMRVFGESATTFTGRTKCM